MTDTYQLCPRCGAELVQIGADVIAARYKCPFCGYMKSVSLTEQSNLEYSQKRSEILTRVLLGLSDWKTTQWKSLQNNILDFIGRYEVAKKDIQLQMSIVACITSGFQLMDAEKYKQCKIIFKATEKMYKQHLKTLKRQADAELNNSVASYQELRAKYKKCRNEYRNTKLIWKAVFFLFKRIVFQ